MHEAFWNGLFDVRWEEAPLGPEAIRLVRRLRERGYASGRAGITGTPSFISAGTCTKSWKATGFAMRGSSRTSSPAICRGVAVTAARRAGEKNRPGVGTPARHHPMARRPLNHRKLC